MPYLLKPGAKCFSIDKRLECQCRCEEQFGKNKGFYINHDTERCACSGNRCTSLFGLGTFGFQPQYSLNYPKTYNWDFRYKAKGKCNDAIFLPGGEGTPLLPPSAPLFDANRVRECGSRCREYAEMNPKVSLTTFFIFTDGKCACTSGDCSSRWTVLGASAYRVYTMFDK